MVGQYKFEPSNTEIFLTELLGNTLLRNYYKNFVKSMNLVKGDRVLDYCSGSGIISKLIAKGNVEGRFTYADVSDKWLTHVKNKLRSYPRAKGIKIKYFSGNIDGENFDKIVIYLALHDFPKSYQLFIIEQLIKNLKPEGMLLIREQLSPDYGIQLHELVNILESTGKLSFEYKIKKSWLIGDYTDIKCKYK